MRTNILVAGSLLTVILHSSAFAESDKIGYVDMEKAFAGLDATSKASDQLKSKANGCEEGLKIRSTVLQAKREELEKPSQTLSEEDRAYKQKEYDMLEESALVYRDKCKRDLRDLRDDLREAINKELEKTVRAYGKLKGYVVIFSKKEDNEVVFPRGAASGSFSRPDDLTEDVVKLFNEIEKK